MLEAGVNVSLENELTHIGGSLVESTHHTLTEGSTAILQKTVEELLTLSKGKSRKEASGIVAVIQNSTPENTDCVSVAIM